MTELLDKLFTTSYCQKYDDVVNLVQYKGSHGQHVHTICNTKYYNDLRHKKKLKGLPE